jgi:hypothetical protein
VEEKAIMDPVGLLRTSSGLSLLFLLVHISNSVTSIPALIAVAHGIYLSWRLSHLHSPEDLDRFILRGLVGCFALIAVLSIFEIPSVIMIANRGDEENQRVWLITGLTRVAMQMTLAAGVAVISWKVVKNPTITPNHEPAIDFATTDNLQASNV